MKKKSFEQWMKEVNELVAKKCGGLTAGDLPDCPYADWYEDGVSAKSAASRAVKNAKE